MPTFTRGIESGLPQFTGTESTEDKLAVVQNFLFMLLEELRYILRNLGEDNFNAAESEKLKKLIGEAIKIELADGGNTTTLEIDLARLSARMTDAEGNIAELALTADGLNTRVTNAEGDISTLNQTAAGLNTRVTSAEGDISTLEQTTSGLSSTVSSHTGSISELNQTANSLTTRMTSAEGSISTLSQTASGLNTRVTNAEGDISTLNQTAAGLATRVTSAENDISAVEQTATGLTTRITSAEGDISTLEQTTSGLTTRVGNAEGDISTLEQTTEGIKSQVTDASGNYTVLNLKSDGLHVGNASGTTKIAGSSIQAASLQLTDNISFNNVASTASGAESAAAVAATTAASAASDAADADALARALAGGTPIAASVGTFINGKNIYSPNIYTNMLTLQPPAAASTGTWNGGMLLKGYYGSTLFDMLKISYFQGDDPVVLLESPDRGALRLDFLETFINGDIWSYSDIRANAFITGAFGTAAPTGGGTNGELYFQIVS